MAGDDVLGLVVCFMVVGVVAWNLRLMWREAGPYASPRADTLFFKIAVILTAASTPPVAVLFLMFAGAILGWWAGLAAVLVPLAVMVAGWALGIVAVVTGRPGWIVPPVARPWPGALALDRLRALEGSDQDVR